MKLRTKKHIPSCDINMAPLIDVVFLLIIFFMVISQFTQIEVDDLTLPTAQKKNDLPATEERPLIVNIHQNGTIVIAGTTHTLNSLAATLSYELTEKPPEDLSILIRADKETSWPNVSAAMQTCTRQGINNVRVAVTDLEESRGAGSGKAKVNP